MMDAPLQLVGQLSDLPEYPIDPDIRLDSHAFLMWEFRRWLSSEFRWNGAHEAKSIWFELVNMAYGETPVGTLPLDHGRLCRMVQPPVDPHRFEALCRDRYGPLYGWVRCRCGDDVRLMHPVVTRIVLSALASRANNQAKNEAASNARRLKRLTEEVGQLAPNLAQDPRKIRWIDVFLQEIVDKRGGQRRTADELHLAIQECLKQDRVGRFPRLEDP